MNIPTGPIVAIAAAHAADRAYVEEKISTLAAQVTEGLRMVEVGQGIVAASLFKLAFWDDEQAALYTAVAAEYAAQRLVRSAAHAITDLCLNCGKDDCTGPYCRYNVCITCGKFADICTCQYPDLDTFPAQSTPEASKARAAWWAANTIW